MREMRVSHIIDDLTSPVEAFAMRVTPCNHVGFRAHQNQFTPKYHDNIGVTGQILPEIGILTPRRKEKMGDRPSDW